MRLRGREIPPSLRQNGCGIPATSDVIKTTKLVGYYYFCVAIHFIAAVVIFSYVLFALLLNFFFHLLVFFSRPKYFLLFF